MTTDQHLNSAGPTLRRASICMEVLVRELFANSGFVISVLLAVAITVGFAFFFEASFQIVVSMLVLGLFTAIAEYVMRARRQPP